MALTRRHVVAGLIVLAAAAVVAGYLHDPPWLITMTSGMRPWETDAEGGRFRWIGGHASFFVPSAARAVEIPIRTTFDNQGDWPVTVSIALDDRPVDRFVLRDPRWHSAAIRLPPAGSRKVRRIDIHLDRTREDNRGAAVGEVRIR